MAISMTKELRNESVSVPKYQTYTKLTIDKEGARRLIRFISNKINPRLLAAAGHEMSTKKKIGRAVGATRLGARFERKLAGGLHHFKDESGWHRPTITSLSDSLFPIVFRLRGAKPQRKLTEETQDVLKNAEDIPESLFWYFHNFYFTHKDNPDDSGWSRGKEHHNMNATQNLQQSQDAARRIQRALGLSAQYKHWVTSNMNKKSIWTELIEARVFDRSTISYIQTDFSDFERVCFAVAIIGANENQSSLKSALSSINGAYTENPLFPN